MNHYSCINTYAHTCLKPLSNVWKLWLKIQIHVVILKFMLEHDLNLTCKSLKWASLIAHRLVGLQTLWQFWLKDLSIDELVGNWYFGCCQAHQGLLVWFLLLPYSVLCTFPCGILVHVWYLIVSIPDLCHLSYFDLFDWCYKEMHHFAILMFA